MAREASDDHRTSSRRHSSGYGDRSHRHRSSRQTDRNSYRTDTGLSPEKLTSLNEQLGWSAPRAVRRDEKRHRVERPRHADRVVREHRRQRNVSDDFYYRNEQGRVASGAPLVETYDDSEKRRSRRHYDRKAEEREHRKRRRRRWLIIGIIAAILLVVIIGVAAGISASKHKQDAKSDSSRPSNANLNGISESSIPASAKGTYLDPFTWYDTTDFNVTYTADQVGGLSVMGLDSSWNDNVRANPTVPPLTERWEYGKRSIRGVNLGGWLSLEPFIVPSLFNTTYPNLANPSIPGPPYIDEWSLTSALGPAASLALLDKHYSSFAPTSTFAAIRAAGFDHIRIPFSYWAVTTYPGDPYVQHISWRYLLCGIEYARQNGLRVNLDLHAAPGSQNGWNHSGRQGAINWLSGTDGALNAERTLAIHAQLATFFAQPRYANVVTLYGVLNEPNMELLPPTSVLNWTTTALTQLRRSPLPNTIILVISNGFLPLPFWHAALAPTFPDPSASRILLDAHQYVIFNPDQLSLNHTAKLSYACDGWAQQTAASMSSTTGFGNFLCGEWSQADTDCAKYINDVGYGARWDGTLDTGNAETSVLTPACSLGDARCSCATANALPSSYSSSYKRYLRAFADAQMRSFGTGWGWFYWTWDVEEGPGAAQLSWKKGVEAGILPKDVSSASDGGRFGCQGEEVNVAGSYWEGVGLGEGF